MAEVHVSYWNEHATEGTRSELVECSVRCLKDGCSNINEISSIVDHCAFGTVGIDKFAEAAPSRSGSGHEEIVEPDVNAKDDDKNCDLESILTEEEGEASRLRGEMRFLLEKCRSESVEALADILAAISLA